MATILVVEDNAVIADLIRWRLTEMGYEVTACVSTGMDAIEEVKNRLPDLILMDIDLPGGMDGIEAATIIKERFNCRFMYLTSLYDDSVVSRARSTSPRGYIVKPFSDSQLKASVEMALSDTEN